MRHSTDQQPDPPFCTPTRKQQAFLDRHCLQPNRPLDCYEAAALIGQFVRSRRALAPTARQEQFLKKRGKWRDGMSRGEAFDLIRRLVVGNRGLS
jgi:hypothetical protein